MDKKRALPIVVKETVDFIYELLINSTDGVQFSFKDFGKTEQRIVAFLLKRGIITKTPISTGKRGCAWKYKWIASLHPTKVLYGSIVDEYRYEQKAWKIRFNEKRKKDSLTATNEKKEDDVVLPVVEPPQKERINALAGFSDQELWDELKKRGYSIEDNRLVTVKKTYLD